jgi:hypothetical protein
VGKVGLDQQEDDNQYQQHVDQRRHIHFCFLMEASPTDIDIVLSAPWLLGH